MNRRYCYISSVIAACLAFVATPTSAQITSISKAEQLLLRGNYAESAVAYEQLLEQFPVQATLGLARGHWERGQHGEAVEQLERQLKDRPDSSSLNAERAWIALQCGDLEECQETFERALAADATHAQALYVQAEWWRNQGVFERACSGYREMASLYDRNSKSIQSARRLYWFGRALAQHARFNQDKKRFRELTTRLYPRLLSLEPNFWSAHYETASLLLEKFNASDAEAAFNDALQINPNSADIQVGLAKLALNEFQLDRTRRYLDRALRTNPSHLGALHCQSDMEFASSRPAAALESLKLARKINAKHPGTLGRLAAAYSILHGDHLAKLSEVLHAAETIGCQGEYFAVQGAALEMARRYPSAGVVLQRAIESAPQLLGPRGQLGMIEMRLGHEKKARRWLEESFQRDPYNVRVKNQLEVLDLLRDYTTLETEHFIIRYDAEHDATLARHMARHAEQCYDELTTTFDFQLPERAVLEIFHDGCGVKSRHWFGARMVGLPNIHTIAACAGNVVAMVSPTAEKRKLNWADILRHEIVHLINIQQTNYAVPHWLTEGCAVWQEDRPRRTEWEKLLARRVPHGDVFNLDSINLGFLRPRSAEDWQLAYCQAEIYVELVAKEYGDEGVRKLLAAYRDNLSTKKAIAVGLGVSQEHIEKAYVKVLRSLSTELSKRDDLREPPKLIEMTRRWNDDPADLALGAELALARLRRGDYPGAGRLAKTVLAQQPSQAMARYVKAQLLVRIGDEKAAMNLLEDVADFEPFEPEALKLLASIHLRRGEWEKAKRLYELGAEQQPSDRQWIKSLAVVAIRTQDTNELKRLLVRIADAEPDNLVARKKLLQLADGSGNDQEIKRWALETLHIAPDDRAALRILQQLGER